MAETRQPIQIFGRRDSRPTQRAMRFFSDRRIPVSLVDVGVRPPALAELRRFRLQFGASALLDTDAAAYRKAGLAYLRMDEEEVFERLLANPGLLRLPLVRHGSEMSIGIDETAWKRWLVEAQAASPPAR